MPDSELPDLPVTRGRVLVIDDEADIREGQKTGFFLDQRENRAWVKDLAAGREVLNCFAYTGAFSVYAAAGGAARVVTVESSSPALEQSKHHMQMNDCAVPPDDFVLADVFAFLACRARRRERVGEAPSRTH